MILLVNIFYLKNVSFGADNVKTINNTYSLAILAEDFSNYRQKVFISASVTPENTISYWIYSSELFYFDINFLSCKDICRKQISQFLKAICFYFCNVSMFL